MIDSVPDHLLLKLTEHQQPMTLLRLMSTCRRMRKIGMASPVWTHMRKEAMLPEPKPGARSLPTDFDILMARGCVTCYQSRRGRFGFCAVCRTTNPFLMRTWALVVREQKRLRWARYYRNQHEDQLKRDMKEIDRAQQALRELESEMWQLSGIPSAA